MSELYLADFNAWVAHTPQLLQEQRWQEVDVARLVAEIEAMGRSDRRAIVSQLTRLLLHLLKWHYQPQHRSDSWLDSITDARTQIELAIADSPSLKNRATEQLEISYQRAPHQASKQTSIASSEFPSTCPYPLDLVLTDD